MSSRYRICHNCGASLTANQAFCPRCGAQYVEPIVQQPGEFEPFPPEQPAASEPTEPYVAQPQQPVVLPPPQQQRASSPPQGQGYAPPPSTPISYDQQAPVTPGQVGGPPPPPQTRRGVSPFLIIVIVVVVLLLLAGISSLLYNLSQPHGSQPGTTPTPGMTPTPPPTRGVTPTPTPTPGTTPTPTPTSVPFQVTTIDMAVSPLTIAGMSCGTQLTVTYTATFHVHPKGPGGAVQFTYTTDGGRTTKTGLVQFNSGQTSKPFQFTSSGTLEPNGAFPGSGQVTTTSPNVVSSQTAIPSGTCTPPPTSTP